MQVKLAEAVVAEFQSLAPDITRVKVDADVMVSSGRDHGRPVNPATA
jgi:hypothetical protein